MDGVGTGQSQGREVILGGPRRRMSHERFNGRQAGGSAMPRYGRVSPGQSEGQALRQYPLFARDTSKTRVYLHLQYHTMLMTTENIHHKWLRPVTGILDFSDSHNIEDCRSARNLVNAHPPTVSLRSKSCLRVGSRLCNRFEYFNFRN